MKGRVFTCGALMALWLATLAGQAGVVSDAMAGPPALTESAFRLGVVSIIPHIPGLIIMGAVCAVVRSACYGSLATDEASFIVVLIGDAAFYFVITYWIAKGILWSAARRVMTLQAIFVVCGVCALLANGALTQWMIWAVKPYYVHPVPRLSIFSFALATLTFLSAFWPLRSNAVASS